jgi:hypothetical protein
MSHWQQLATGNNLLFWFCVHMQAHAQMFLFKSVTRAFFIALGHCPELTVHPLSIFGNETNKSVIYS